MLRSIVLHGRLKAEFGGPFKLDIASPAEAVRALCYMVAGFRTKIREGHYRVVRGRLDGLEYDVRTLPMRLGGARELHIVPVIAGSGGNRGTGKIIAGVALLAAAVIAPYAAPALFAAGGALAGTFAGLSITGVAFSVGASLALSGVAQLLAPAVQTNDGVPQNASFLLGGQVNVATQGGPVPVVYGRFRTGSVTVSAGLTIEQLGSDPFGALAALFLHKST